MWTQKGSIEKYYNLARCLWGILIVLAVLSRAVIPAGMMPDFKSSHDGGFKLTICSSDGMKVIDMPADNEDPSPSKHNTEPCPYAIGVSTAHLVLVLLVILFLEIVRVLWIGLPTIRYKSRHLFTNIYPRAPPCFS